MAEAEKKKRTILMSEDPSEVTPPSVRTRTREIASSMRRYIRPRGVGFGGTIGKLSRKNGGDIKAKWKVGIMKGLASKGIRGNARGPGGGRLRGKSGPGFRFKISF
jgi:hypothetical protein